MFTIGVIKYVYQKLKWGLLLNLLTQQDEEGPMI